MDQEGHTPLLKLVYDMGLGGRRATLEPLLFRYVPLLVKHGADVNAVDWGGRTSLHWAVSWTAPEVMKLLLRRGADSNTVDEEGNTPLHAVATTVNIEMARLLLEYCASPNVKGQGGQSPLARASALEVYHGYLSLRREERLLTFVPLLISYNAEQNPVDDTGRTPLDWAVIRKYPRVERLLRENGATRSK